MKRIMQPKAVAVIGASSENGKIGNSVMKNLINGGYKGQIYPIHPKDREILGFKAYKSVKDVPGEIDTAVFAIPAKFVAGALKECGEKKIAGAILIPSGFGETGNIEGQEELHRDRPRVQHPPDGAEHLRLLLHAGEPVRHVLHGLRRTRAPTALSSQSGGIGMAIIGFSRSAKMGVSAIVGLGNKSDIDEDDLLIFFEQDDRTPRSSPALRGPEGRPRLRRGRQARLARRSRSSCSRPAAPRPAPRPPARTPARWPATTRSTRTCSSSPA